MSKKRVRATNFNETEEDILVQCILRHAKIIENKKTDACTLKEKQSTWEEVAVEFNSLCPNVVSFSTNFVCFYFVLILIFGTFVAGSTKQSTQG